jgi:type IV pilus biogenesis protein CpaD/CtpE
VLARIAGLGVVTVLAAAGLAGCGDDGTGPASTSTSVDTSSPLTVSDLVARSADTPVAVEGFLHGEGGTARLCAAVLESYPPQCGQPWVELAGFDPTVVTGTQTAGGVTWKEGVVLVVQRAPDGRFTVLSVAP